MVDAGEETGEQIADSNRFPGADDGVRQHHDPTGPEAQDRREHSIGISDLPRGIGELLNQGPVDPGDGEEAEATGPNGEPGADGATAAQPVSHDDEPPDSHHAAEAEAEICERGKAPLEKSQGRRTAYTGCSSHRARSDELHRP